MLKTTLLTLLLWLPLLAQAQLTIEITQGVDDPTVIAIPPFRWLGEGTLPEDVAQIVHADLNRSGLFAPVPRENMLSFPSEEKDVFYRDWRQLQAQYLLIGRLRPEPNDRVKVEFELFDVLAQRAVLKGGSVAGGNQLRALAHYVSDQVYEKLTGIRGAFSTQIVYVSEIRDTGGPMYRLMLADADGARERLLLQSRQPILSPNWSPDGKRLAYVSFETGRAAIFLQDIATGRRQQLTNFRGLNGAPVWSPDGNRIALVLSKDGNPEIYVFDLQQRRLERLTRHWAIDTEPEWMPDGQSLVFTSDRGGRPQIYQVALATREVERLTFAGDYNARARITPDGSGLVMVHRSEGVFHIAVQDLERGDVRVLTETHLDESPTVAPNGAMLLYATRHGGKGVLAAVSLDSGVKFRLPSRLGDVREPAWSPYMR